jgi:very-short-patch-repair endonuclease
MEMLQSPNLETDKIVGMEKKELLVALLPKTSALDILKSELWYHIPVENLPYRWEEGWRPKVMAFYQGKVFGKDDAYKIRYFGEVNRVDITPRKELFPADEENKDKADNLYYRIQLKSLQQRYRPIISYRPRRLVFVPTTWEKFEYADQINDLFDGSPLEDRLWKALKYINILAERQWKVVVQNYNYYLDFAVFCNKGKLAIETDGYTTHFDTRNQIDYHTWRQNEIEIDGWRFLHYTTNQVKDDWTPYLSQIQSVVDQLGGVETQENYTRTVSEEKGKYIIDGEEPL